VMKHDYLLGQNNWELAARAEGNRKGEALRGQTHMG
jgi:hypothetical protein